MTKTKFNILLLAFLISGIAFNSCVKDTGQIPVPPSISLCDSLNVTYTSDIKPILISNCAVPTCHVPAGTGPGDYNDYATVKAAVDMGVFKQRVIVTKDMPPPPPPVFPLPDSTLQKINCWLDDGAPNN